MASLLEVYRASLSHAGVELVSSVDDTTPQGVACQVHFLPIYQALLSLGEWDWAVRRDTRTAKTFSQPSQSNYRGSDGYIVIDPPGHDFQYQYELPINRYPYDTSEPAFGHLDRVRPIGIVRRQNEEPSAFTSANQTDPDTQLRWTEEGRYLLTDYTDVPRPAADDALRGSWLPSVTIRFVAHVDVAYAKGPFVEALQALLGAVIARKFRRSIAAEQSILAYGQAQLKLAFEALPNPIDWRAIQFRTVEDVPAAPEAQ